jgi:hypothetical protein
VPFSILSAACVNHRYPNSCQSGGCSLDVFVKVAVGAYIYYFLFCEVFDYFFLISQP